MEIVVNPGDQKYLEDPLESQDEPEHRHFELPYAKHEARSQLVLGGQGGFRRATLGPCARAISPDMGEDSLKDWDGEQAESEERKETEQLPLTKDLMGHQEGAFCLVRKAQQARNEFLDLQIPDDSDDMHGVEVEVSDSEKHVA